MIKYASLVDFDSDVWSMACLLVPADATATIQEGKHLAKIKQSKLAYNDILVNSKIRLNSVKRMTEIQNIS